MMNDFTMASAREINLFMRQYCRNEQTRLRIAKKFRVDTEVYEVLAPGQKVYSWINGGKLINGAVVAFQIKDMEGLKLYYPVFPEVIGKQLLKAWRLPAPPKWSIYQADSAWLYDTDADGLNKEMRKLLIYGRLFISMQQQVFCPLPYSFKEIYNQLSESSDISIDASVIKMVNNVLREYMRLGKTFTNCRNLQDFIIYMRNKYTLLPLLDADFSGLRQLLAQAGETECYF